MLKLLLNPIAQLSLTILTALALHAAPAQALDIVSCGQAIPEGEVGTLQNDIDCGASGTVAIGKRATLRLGGHAITGGSFPVRCVVRACTIEGPGEISGASGCGISSQQNVGTLRFHLKDIDVHHNGCGIQPGTGSQARFFLENVTVRDNTFEGMGSTSGSGAGRVKGTNVTVTGNGGRGIEARFISLDGALIQDNGGYGIFNWFGPTKLRDAIITGNDTDTGIDVATRGRPRLKDSTCGRSVVVPKFPGQPDMSSPSWGVCTGD